MRGHMNVEYTMSIGDILQIGTIVIGGLGVVWALKSDVKLLKEGAKNLKDDLVQMQVEIKKLAEVLVNVESIRGDIRVVQARIAANEQDIREFRNRHQERSAS
jgi:predicted  nucleic acid-binding Zn-ribbon protein